MYYAYMTQTVVTLNEQGRVVVPVELRRQLELSPGAQLVTYVEDGRLILESREHLLRRMQREFRAAADDSSVVDELIAERRAEAARDSD